MHKRLLNVLLITFLALAGTAAAETAWLTSLDEALKQAERRDSYVLVDLYADWCGWCKVLEKEVFSTAEFRDYARDFVLLRVDVDDGGEGSALQARFGAYSLPTTLVMDKNQVKIGSVEGFAPTPAFLRRLSGELATYDKLLESYEKVKTSDDLGLLYRLADELHNRGDGPRVVEVYHQIVRLTGEGSPKAAWIHYLLADAYRLAGRYDDAVEDLRRARTLSKSVDSRELQERIDLLGARIAQDRHDCEQARSSYESFLEKHPRSTFRGDAERTLDALRNGEVQGCV